MSTAQFRVDHDAAKNLYRLSGVLDERVNLTFMTELQGSVTFNLKEVRRINSRGVRSWIEAIRQLPAGVTVEVVECSPTVVDQMNMIAGFLGECQVGSFYAPLVCETCDIEEERLFSIVDCVGGRLPSVACSKCKQPMGMDDMEEQYLLFLRE